MRENILDLKTSDLECSNFLRRTIHTGPPCDEDSSEENSSDVEVEDPCIRKFGGLCDCHPNKEAACKLVKVFNRCLLDKKVRPGSLLLLTTDSDSFLGFLGACMKKPLQQTFLRAEADPMSDRVTVLGLPDSRSDSTFSCVTSHQLFSEIITASSDCVTVQVWEYTVKIEGKGFILQTVEVKQEFKLDPNEPIVVRKPHGKLPFGLRMPKRKAQQQHQKKKKKKKQTKQKQESHDGKRKPWRSHKKESEDSETGNKPSDSDASSVHSSHHFGPSSSAGLEADAYVPVSDQMEEEEKLVDKIISKHEAARDAAEKVEEPEAVALLQASSAASAANPAPSAATAQAGKSFFSNELGLESVSLAVSGRSGCYFCKNKIPKGSVRYCWYHNRLRPSAWVHQGCLKHLAQKEGVHAETKCKLEELQAKPCNNNPQIAAAVASVLASFSQD